MPLIKKFAKVCIVFTIIVLLVVVLMCVMEYAIRLTPLKNTVLYPEESLYYHEEHPTRVIDIKPGVTDGHLSFYGNSFPIWSNELGCFDDAYNGETPFIYLAGDSLSWGYAPLSKKWGTYLEQFTGTRVLKCAVTASGTYHQYLKAKDILTTYPNPDVIVVGYFSANDVWDDYKFPQFVYRQGGRYDNPTPGSLPTEETYRIVDERIQNYSKYCTLSVPAHPMLQFVKCYLYKNSVLYKLTTQGAKHVLQALLPSGVLAMLHINPPTSNTSLFLDPPEEAYPVHFDAIKQFRNLAEEHGATLVFALIPSREEVYPELFGTSTSQVRSKVIAFLEQEHIRYIDLQPVFHDISRMRQDAHTGRPGDLYWETEWHLSPLGNLVTGWAVAKYLHENKISSGNENTKNSLQESYTSILHNTE